VSELDTLQAFAAVATEYNYVKPELHLMDNNGLGAESFLLVNFKRLTIHLILNV
jgi:DNA mismatch repair ATPase MutS